MRFQENPEPSVSQLSAVSGIFEHSKPLTADRQQK
jgi:hypothetical protein